MRRALSILIIAALFSIPMSAVFATDRLVPSQYPTIQAAINAAQPGETVIVAPGTYTGSGNKNLDFGGKAITVSSVNPADPNVIAATVIDCQKSGRGFYFHSGETSASVVAGLTITNGSADKGGAIYSYNNSSPTIKNCVLSNNYAFMVGGGMASEFASPTVKNCAFRGNTSNLYGGGLYCGNCPSVLLQNCIFSGNSAKYGGGVKDANSSMTITGCTFSTNRGGLRGGAIEHAGPISPVVRNCILWGDSAPNGAEIYGDCLVSYSDVQGGYAGTGNINADPRFVNPVGGDCHLLAGSSCIDAGDPSYQPQPGETDIDGQPRAMGTRVDMGADEFVAALVPEIKVSPTQLEFIAGLGGPNPAPQILSIRNSGLSTLNWQVTEDCSWLSVSPASGQSTGEVDNVTVSVNIAGLGLGQYNCDLTVSDPCASNSPQTVSAVLTIQRPVIEVSPQQLQFAAGLGGPNPPPQILSIRNSGYSTLNWQVTEYCSWLSVSPASGQSTGEVDNVTVSVNIAGLGAGQYSCDLTISDPCASNSPQTVYVVLTIEGPVIEVSPQQLQFAAGLGGPNPTPQILSIRNSGLGTLNWQVTEDCSWLSVSPASGQSTGEVDNVTVTVNIAGLGAGQYSCDLTVSDPCASNSPQMVAVTLTVQTPRTLHVPSQYPTIQAAIDAAGPGDTVIVAPGVYTVAGNRDLDFGGKAITVRSTNPEDPCVVAATVIDCQGSSGSPHRGFWFHSGEGATSVVAGLSIINGYSDYGGGIVCSQSSPKFESCVFSENVAMVGGGAYNSQSRATFTGCEFRGNLSNPGSGGGMYNSDSGLMLERCSFIGNLSFGDAGGGIVFSGCKDSNMPKVINCLFSGNSARYWNGGGMFIGYCDTVTVVNCTFASNIAGRYGGGITVWFSSLSLTGCIFTGNTAYDRAGGGVDAHYGQVSITNCTFTGNKAYAYGGAIYRYDATVEVKNSILWGDTASEGTEIDGAASVSYSDVEGGYLGQGNIDVDPCFVSGPGGDYYLSQVAAGQLVNSPCVNAGSDLAVNLGMDAYTTRTDEVGDAAIVDMGYHYPMPNPADIDGDGDVDFADFAILADQWLQPPGVPSADIAPPGGDGVVDEKDLAMLGRNWLWGK